VLNKLPAGGSDSVSIKGEIFGDVLEWAIATRAEKWAASYARTNGDRVHSLGSISR